MCRLVEMSQLDRLSFLKAVPPVLLLSGNRAAQAAFPPGNGYTRTAFSEPVVSVRVAELGPG